MGEVLGTRKTIVFAPMQLAAGLPYRLEAITARYSEIPNQLRNKYTVSLAEKTPLAVATDAKIFNVTLPLSLATSKAVALSFVPATQADEDLLLSYLPQDGSGHLPTELPGYLIYMKAQLTLDGEVIAEGGSFAMGTELNLTHNFYDPRRSVRPVSSNVIAGEYHAIGVDGGSINPFLFAKVRHDYQRAEAELEYIREQGGTSTDDQGGLPNKHGITGNLLQSGILGYFATNDALDQLDAKSIGVVTHRLPSIGTFSTSLEPQYLFGSIPRNVKLAGLTMDVDRISTLSAAKDDDAQKDITFFRTTGPRKSAFEHLVPELLFATTEQPVEAISAVKALAIAASQGQKTYMLTKTNQSQLNTLTISPAAKSDIAAALNASKEVTVHEGQIAYAGWAGEGYIVIDPQTGAGAYKISGGANGAATVLRTGHVVIAMTDMPLAVPASSGAPQGAPCGTPSTQLDAFLMLLIVAAIIVVVVLATPAILAFGSAVAAFFMISSTASAAGEPIDECFCEKLYEVDSSTCRGISRKFGGAAGQRCWASAAERNGACLAGRNIPELDTRRN